MSKYKPIRDFVSRLKALEKSGFEFEATIFVFIGIDMMTLLALPLEKQTRSEFKKWVETYFFAHPEQPYQYNSDDIYAARCSILHNYGAVVDIHNKNPKTKIFGFTNGGKHLIDPKVSENLVMIGTVSFINDFIIAVENFLKAAEKDKILQKRIDSRIDNVFAFFPIND